MRKCRIIVWLMLLCLVLTACAGQPAAQQPQEQAQSVVLSEKLKIHIIDVGQGDSTLVELPNGTAMLIDAGEREYGRSVVSYVKALGYKRIDYLVGTHPHSDHIGGLQTVIESFDIGNIYMPKKSSTTATFTNLLKAIQKKGLKVETAKAGKLIFEDENLNVSLISPVNDNYGDEMNLYSAVVKITYGEMRFLFMGDAETENEEQMTDVSAEFIRIGHHGSRTSSGEEFVRRVGAQIAVVSVGEDNSYGLPNDDVLSRWKAAGATLYRTDQSGSLVFESDGASITVGDAVVAAPSDEGTEQIEEEQVVPDCKWVLNTSTKKIHYPECSAVSRMNEENKSESDKSIAALEAEGYTVCGTCDPVEG